MSENKPAIPSDWQEWIKEENPYPEDIFLPITGDELKQIHEMLLEKFNMPIDRLTGHIGRLLRKGLAMTPPPFIQQLEQQLAEKEKEMKESENKYHKILLRLDAEKDQWRERCEAAEYLMSPSAADDLKEGYKRWQQLKEQ